MRRECFTRCVVGVLVVGGHVLLIALLAGSHPRIDSRVARNTSILGRLVVVELPLSPQPPAPAESEPPRTLATPSRAPPVAPPVSGTAILAPPVSPSIDWYREAEIVAREATTRAMPPVRTDCDETPSPGSLRPKCRKDPSEFLWDPEPRRFGIEGGIPYVRLGPCVVALGAFGCGIGKTEANGELFKDMRHPDRPTSSVPGVDENQR